jgi:hypothetical protein
VFALHLHAVIPELWALALGCCFLVTCDCRKAFKSTAYKKVSIMQLTELEKENVKTTKVSQALSLLWQELRNLPDIEASSKT